MVIDIVCVAALAFFGLVGAWRGFIRQAFSLAAFALIALFAVPLGVMMASPIVEAEEWGAVATRNLRIGLSLGAAVAIYVLVKLIGGVVNRAIGKRHLDGEKTSGLALWNRYWGAALGIVKAGLLCWLVICFFTAFPRIAPGVTERVRQSWSAKTADALNPFERCISPEKRAEMEEALEELWKLKRHPAAWGKVIKEQSVQDVLKHERIRRLLDEDNGDIVGALADKGFRESLGGIDWGNIADIAKEARSDAEEN